MRAKPVVFTCCGLCDENADSALQYVTDLNTAMRMAMAESKRVMLYTGTAQHLGRRTPRTYFSQQFLAVMRPIRKTIKDQRLDPADTTIKGVGSMLMKPGDDWFSIQVDDETHLRKLTKKLEALKTAPR